MRLCVRESQAAESNGNKYCCLVFNKFFVEAFHVQTTSQLDKWMPEE